MSKNSANCNCLKLNFSLRDSSIMAITHEERSHSAARPHTKMWPGFGGYESGGEVIRQRSWPPFDAVATAPGIAGRHGCNVVAASSQFMKHNV